MREFKFRAWHKETEEMHTGYKAGQIFLWQDQGQPIEIMQYTGLSDEYGKEIYEGDRLFDEHNEEWATVVFDEGKFLAKFETYIIDLWEVCDGLVIRGTIYEALENL